MGAVKDSCLLDVNENFPVFSVVFFKFGQNRHGRYPKTFTYLFTYLLHSPSWEANWFAASQEIPRILFSGVSLPHSQVPATCPYPEPAQWSSYTTFHFPKINLTIILPSKSGPPPVVSFSQFFPPKPCTRLSPPHKRYMPHPSNSRFYRLHNSGRGYGSLSSSLCSYLHSPVTLSLIGPNILLNTRFSNILSLRSSLSVSDQVSHPYKTTGKILFLYKTCIL
jgi:hypothetical protein